MGRVVQTGNTGYEPVKRKLKKCYLIDLKPMELKKSRKTKMLLKRYINRWTYDR